MRTWFYLLVLARYYVKGNEDGCILPDVTDGYFVLSGGGDAAVLRTSANSAALISVGSSVTLQCNSGYVQTTTGADRATCRRSTNGTFELSTQSFRRCVVSNFNECGVGGQTGRIFGGEAVALGDLPWMARLRIAFEGSAKVQQCGGSIISREYILTAAHCLLTERKPVNTIVVNVGRTDFSLEDGPGLQLYTREYSIHPNYNVDDSSQKFDFAIIKVNPPIRFSANIRPICLPEDTDEESLCGKESERCNVVSTAGWGRNESGLMSNTLKRVLLSLRPVEECSVNSRLEGMDADVHLYAGGRTDNEDSCQGDSGGPLMCQEDARRSKYYVIGAVSFGRDCGLRDIPGAYSRVCRVLPWLRIRMAGRGWPSTTTAKPPVLSTTEQPVEVPTTTRRRRTTPTTTTTVPLVPCRVPVQNNGYYTLSDGTPVSGDSTVAVAEEIALNCNSPWRLDNSLPATQVCSREGQWVPPLAASCLRPIDCSNTPDPRMPDGFIQPGGVEVGSRKNVRCSSGYSLSGATFITCLANGQWSLPGTCNLNPTTPLSNVRGAPINNLATCNVPYVDYGSFTLRDGTSVLPISSVSQNEQIVLTCSNRYRISGSTNSLLCTELGWRPDPIEVKCVRKPNCESQRLPSVANGLISAGDSEVGDTRAIECLPGFTIRSGLPYITCLQSGQWTTPARCEANPTTPRGCMNQPLPTVAFGYISANGYDVGDTAWITCNFGYTIQGSSYITCGANGQWSTPSRCADSFRSSNDIWTNGLSYGLTTSSPSQSEIEIIVTSIVIVVVIVVVVSVYYC